MNNNLIPMTNKEKAIGWPYLVIQLFFLPVVIVFANFWLKLNLSEALMNVVLFTLDFLFILLIFHRFLYTELRRAGERIPRVLLAAVTGFALYWVLSIAVSIAQIILLPEHVNANNAAINQMASSQYWLMTLGTVLLVPVTEETLFRGLIFGSLYRRNKFLGYILSTVIFAAIHVVGYIGMQDACSLLISFIQYIPAGLALSWAYVRSGTILSPILIHAVVNFIGMAAMR